jgi:hypothetical protein
MLYRLKSNEDVFDLNPELYAIPEFQNLRDRQMKLVILFADLKSPLKSLPSRLRRLQAWKAVGGPTEEYEGGSRPDKNGRNWISGQVASVEKAIAKYLEIQFDEGLDKLNTMRELIQRNSDYIRDLDPESKTYGKDLERANKLAKELPDLLEAQKRMESIFNVTEPPTEIEVFTSEDIPAEMLGENPDGLSTLDIWSQSQTKKNENAN